MCMCFQLYSFKKRGYVFYIFVLVLSTLKVYHLVSQIASIMLTYYFYHDILWLQIVGLTAIAFER